MKTTKELADAERDREYLVSRGYRRVPCDNPLCIRESVQGMTCTRCGGKGYKWEAPTR